MFEGVQDRVMLGAIADQMLSVRRAAARETKQREIARLGAAAGENQFVRLHLEQGGEAVARLIDRRARLTPSAMDARRISKMLLEIGLHGTPGRRTERGGGVVIEVDHRMNACCKK